MSARSRRQRSSTVASSPPEATRSTAELQQLLDHLSATLQTPSAGNEYPNLSKVIDQATSVRRHLIASLQPSRANDDFRHLNGFQTLIDTLRAFSGFLPSYKTKSKRENTTVRAFGNHTRDPDTNIQRALWEPEILQEEGRGWWMGSPRTNNCKYWGGQ